MELDVMKFLQKCVSRVVENWTMLYIFPVYFPSSGACWKGLPFQITNKTPQTSTPQSKTPKAKPPSNNFNIQIIASQKF